MIRSVDASRADAFKPTDRERINRAVFEPVGFEEVNRVVSAGLTTWLLSSSEVLFATREGEMAMRTGTRRADTSSQLKQCWPLPTQTARRCTRTPVERGAASAPG
eukprot:3856376-Prymnesium_polylepis.2